MLDYGAMEASRHALAEMEIILNYAVEGYFCIMEISCTCLSKFYYVDKMRC